jgi:glycine/D-amino acid oxidase-like deaminating enzyme
MSSLWAHTARAAPTTPELTRQLSADVVILGAGITGSSTALHLAGAGRDAVVLEAREIGFGGSGRNVGLVNAGLWVMPDLVSSRLGEKHGERLLSVLGRAPDLVFELIAKHGIDCEAVRAGTLHCAVGEVGLRQIERRAAQWHARGAPVSLLNASETAARTGTAGYTGALFDERAGTIHPLGYVRGLARAALSQGARIFTGSPALRAERSGGNWRIHTPRGSIRAPRVVIATDVYGTGPWNVVQTEQVRLPYFNLATEPLQGLARQSILPGGEGAWDTLTVLSSFRRDAAGRLIFGSVGALGAVTGPLHRHWAREELTRLFPQTRGVRFESDWFGYIGMTRDDLPRFHIYAPGVVGFSAFNGRGIAPGTVFGRLVAQLVSGGLSEEDLPLPVTSPRSVGGRLLKGWFYNIGSAVAHFARVRV